MRASGRIVWLLLVSALLNQACGKVKEFEYRGVSNVRLNVMPKPLASADIRLFNPNNLTVRLREAEISVLVNGKKAGEVVQQFDVVVPRKSDFTVPVEIAVSLREGGLMGALGGMLSGKSIPVQLTGFVKVLVHGVPVKIPVDHIEEIRMGK